MASFTIDINTSDLTTRLSPDKLTEAKQKGLEYSSQELIRVLMRNSPVDHGLLKSWFLDSLSSDEAVIKSPAEYAQWVNDGTRPYTITPKGQGTYIAGRQITSGSALWWPGADHPVRVVHHPGIKGRHFVEDSLADVNGRLDGYFLRAISEVIG